MSKIIRAIVFLVILYFVNEYFQYSVFSTLIDIAFFAAFIYLIIAIFNFVKPSSNRKGVSQNIVPRQTNTYPVASNLVISSAPVQPTSHKSSSALLLFAVFVIGLLIFLLREILGQFSFEVFGFLDNLLKFTESIPPFIAWSILGLFVGAVYGSMVAWKKYHLHFAINLLPIAGLLLVILILFIINQPTINVPVSNTILSEPVNTDTTSSLPTRKYIINRWLVVDILGKGKDNFRKKNNETSDLEFRKNGKCYLNENGVRKMILYYKVSPSGKSIVFNNPNNTAESRQIEVISIDKNEMVIKSELFQNDTAILRPR